MVLTLIYLAEYDYTRESCSRIAGNGRVIKEDSYGFSAYVPLRAVQVKATHITTSLGGHIFVGFFDEHDFVRAVCD